MASDSGKVPISTVPPRPATRRMWALVLEGFLIVMLVLLLDLPLKSLTHSGIISDGATMMTYVMIMLWRDRRKKHHAAAPVGEPVRKKTGAIIITAIGLLMAAFSGLAALNDGGELAVLCIAIGLVIASLGAAEFASPEDKRDSLV